MTIRARLTNGDIATYIGPDPNGGHVIRTTNGDMHTVDELTPEFNTIEPQPITGVYQGAGPYGICSWPTIQDAHKYVTGQLSAYGRLVPLGQIIHHQGLIVIADSTGQPLKAGQ
jgi:hypothetical protein